jgi:hypothetical protein
MTDLGPLELAWDDRKQAAYENLLPDATVEVIEPDLRVCVVGVQTPIASKSESPTTFK